MMEPCLTILISFGNKCEQQRTHDASWWNVLEPVPMHILLRSTVQQVARTFAFGPSRMSELLCR